MSILTAAAATAVALSAQSAAHADPKLTTDQAKSQVDADRKAAAAATEQYNGAQLQQQALQRKVNLLQDEIARQQGQVNKEVSQLGAMASAQYREGGVDPTVALMLASDPTDYLTQASTQSELNSSEATVLAQLQVQEQTLAREKAQAAQELGAQQALLTQMQKAKASAQARLNHAQSVLNALTPAQQKQVNAGGGGGNNYGSAGTVDNHMTVSQINLSGISSAARTAMLAAMSKVGIAPYSMGGAGPNEFDCSGLVMWSYAHAGVSLPHYSYSDETVGSPVASLADAKVGDIIVLEGGAHVGLYAGNGMLLNAPQYGYTVSIQPLSYFGSIVAIRRF
ncbi:NlpC/P60 family protein [Streptacidiphilus sp. MAP12-16]|uniref:C40 family peptidase n=1 Tax=Streptacidiphilus sp. MAP12-16 TaxID=3156300 RepID=UPI0035134993